MTTEAKARSKNALDYDFTDVELLTKYVTETGKILPRRITGLTAKQQRNITKSIKRARAMLLMK
jgi:small subunit ribosomal protein S18